MQYSIAASGGNPICKLGQIQSFSSELGSQRNVWFEVDLTRPVSDRPVTIKGKEKKNIGMDKWEWGDGDEECQFCGHSGKTWAQLKI